MRLLSRRFMTIENEVRQDWFPSRKAKKNPAKAGFLFTRYDDFTNRRYLSWSGLSHSRNALESCPETGGVYRRLRRVRRQLVFYTVP